MEILLRNFNTDLFCTHNHERNYYHHLPIITAAYLLSPVITCYHWSALMQIIDLLVLLATFTRKNLPEVPFNDLFWYGKLYVLILLHVPSGARTIAHEEHCCLVTVRVYVCVSVRIGGEFSSGSNFPSVSLAVYSVAKH